MLAAAAARAAEPGFPRDVVQAVLATAFDVVLDRHVEPAEPGALGLWALRGLAVIDPALRPEWRADTLLLSDTRRLLGARPVPAPPGDTVLAVRQLAVAVAALFDAAWRASPALRRAGSDRMLQSGFEEIFNHLDPYSRYLTPAEAAAARSRRIGHLDLGLALAAGRRGSVLVAAVVPGGTAARAGFQPGDRLLAIGEVWLPPGPPEAAARLFEGPAGTIVPILVQRGTRRIELLLPREVVPPETVHAERRDDILWLRIDGFASETDASLERALSAGPAGPAPRGIVLDLRGNRGGLLSQAVSVASAFLAGGPVVRTEGRHPDALRVYTADAEDRAHGLPLVVLVDGRSASAAEIVAASLADRGRAVVVGSATMGKGLIQVVAPLPNGGELQVSWARVVAPSGWPIQGLGVLPSVCTGSGEAALAAELLALAQGEAGMAATLSRARAIRAGAPAPEVEALRARCPPAEGRDWDLYAARRLLETPHALAAALGRRPVR